MSARRIAVHATVYPAALRFVRAWHESVLAQSDRDFDLWISLDGVTRADVAAAAGAAAAAGPMPNATWLEVAPGTSPGLVRQQALEVMVGTHDYIVPADIDDLLLPSRIDAARRALDDSDLAACALAVMDEEGRDVGVTFAPPADADAVRMLPYYNVFGFSNSAWRADVLRRCLPIPAGAVLYDWLLATRAWSLGAALRFDRVPRMRYRQYANNTAAVLTPFTDEQVRIATMRVVAHYALALDGEWQLAEPYRAQVAAARKRCAEFAAAIASPELLARYIHDLNRLPPHYVWWWSVANPDLEEIWRS